MPSTSRTQDEQANPRPRTVEGLFDSSPTLEDTRPFSLLNALLADVPGAVHYEAPAFRVEEEPEDVDPPAGQVAAALLKQCMSSPVAKADPREVKSHSPSIDDEPSKWPAATRLEKHLTSETRVEDPVTEELTPEGPLKLEDKGARMSWAKRGFVGGANRPKPSTDPLSKAIKIFESLSSPQPESHPVDRDGVDPPPQTRLPPVLEEDAAPETPPARTNKDATGPHPTIVEESESGEPATELPTPAVQDEEPAQIAPVSAHAASAAPTEIVQLEELGDQITEPVQAHGTTTPKAVEIDQTDRADRPTAPITEIDPADQPTAPVGEIDPADQPTAPIGFDLPPIQVSASGARVDTGDKAIESTANNIGLDVDGDAATQPIRMRGPSAPEVPPEDEPGSAWSLNAARVFLSNTETRQETVNDKVASLLDILETVLPGKGAEANKAVTNDDEITRPYQVPPPPKPKIKLVPRTVKDKGDFDITAPVTVVAPETPVSPFTKIADGATKEVRPGPPPRTVTQPARPPQAPAGAITAMPPAVPKPAASSPFTVINRGPAKTPPAVKEPLKIPPNPDFASPFSSAMRRQIENRPAMEKGPAVVAPITPPDELANEAETLPQPAYSFSNLEPAPTVQHSSAPRPFSSSTATPKPKKAVRSSAGTATIEQELEKPAWGFLTILLACIFVGFLLLYIVEIYKELRSPRIPIQEPARSEAVDVIPSEANASAATPMPLADVDLNEPLETIKAFLSAPTIEARLPFVLEDESVVEPMRKHYALFGGLGGALPDTMAIVDGGSLPGTDRAFVTARLHWTTGDQLNIRLISQDAGKHQFSWYAFEQWRHQLFAKFVTGEWAEWNHFYVEIRPSEAPSYVPEMVRSDSLWYEVASPEYPDFTTIAAVRKDWPIANEFVERFQADRKYEVVAQLERARDEEGMILDHLTIVRLLNDGWGPMP